MKVKYYGPFIMRSVCQAMIRIFISMQLKYLIMPIKSAHTCTYARAHFKEIQSEVSMCVCVTFIWIFTFLGPNVCVCVRI